jgi:hypothetical protein
MQTEMSPTTHTPASYATTSHIPSASGSTLNLFPLGSLNNAVHISDDEAPIIRSVSTPSLISGTVPALYGAQEHESSMSRSPGRPLRVARRPPAVHVQYGFVLQMERELPSYFEEAISIPRNPHFFKANPTTSYSTPADYIGIRSFLQIPSTAGATCACAPLIQPLPSSVAQ